ncbi:MAG TPA: hypothetical protein VKU62_13715 [Thermoanaerobaculia bacterium]|nr:hypothetical protein [Thermoanaerobaculia bacterium]
MRRLITITLLLLAGTARAEFIPFSAEVGYRWTSTSGNDLLYRTQINERSGLLLRAFSMTTPQLRIDSYDLGTGPASALRIETTNSNLYRLRVGYRTMDAFSALPAFANPLLDQGVVVGQHTFDRSRTMVDADLEFLPQGNITPFIGYSYNRNSGPGTTTYFVGQNEFQMLQSLRETNNEIRGGASFKFSSVYGEITQGWRRYRGTEDLTLAPAAGSGNNLTPILGAPVTADQISSTNQSSVNTPFTNVYVAGTPLKRVKLIGNFSRFSSTSDPIGNEALTGAFVSFPLARDFAGLTESANGRAKNTTWRGGARAEVTIKDGIDFTAGWQRDHRELDGSALISDIYLQTVTFSGLDKKDLQDLLNASNALSREESVWSAGVQARAFGPFAVRAEYRETQQNIDLSPDISEIVVPGASQGGLFKRRIQTYDTGVNWAKSGFNVGVSAKFDRANVPIFRTDYIDRDRYRARAAWTSKNHFITVGGSAEQTGQSNDQSDVGFDSLLRQYIGDVELAPTSILRLRGAFSRYRANTSILARAPQNFSTFDSFHKENGESREAGFGLLLKKASVDAGLTRFTNAGSIPFTLNRYRLRTTFDVKAHFGLALEYSKDKYDQPSAPDGQFNADRYGVFLRWNP